MVNLFQAIQDGLVAQGIQLIAAEIIRPALHVADAQRSQQRLQKGHVAEKELLLQILGSGGDNDPLPGAQCRQQVGQRLAGPGARFDDQMLAFLQAAFHRPRHIQLPAPELIGQRGAREHASGREEVVQRRQRLGGDGCGRQGETGETLSLEQFRNYCVLAESARRGFP